MSYHTPGASLNLDLFKQPAGRRESRTQGSETVSFGAIAQPRAPNGPKHKPPVPWEK